MRVSWGGANLHPARPHFVLTDERRTANACEQTINRQKSAENSV